MSGSGQMHESLVREDVIEGPSNRSFGGVFTVVFAAIGLLPLIRGGEVRVWALAVAGAFFITALLMPVLLAPLNRLWFKFGMLLHRVVSPLVMGMLFYVVVTPTGFLMRLFGKRPLDLDFDPSASSYWTLRQPPGPAPDTMKNQF
jgi:predicted membrane metal-binding protein